MQEDSVRIALLERSQENTEKELSTLREAISEISKVNVRISELLAVHQVRLEQHQRDGEDTNKKVEDGIKNLTVKMESDRKDIFNKMDSNKKDLSNELRSLRDKVFIGVGIGIVLNLVVVIGIPQLFTALSKPGLTNSTTRVTISKP